MFRFLYMFGPGVLSWLVRSNCVEMEKEKNVIYILIEFIVYSFVNMVVIIAVFKPMGRIAFVVLSDGTLDVHYGATALLAEMFLSVVIGILSCWIEKNLRIK